MVDELHTWNESFGWNGGGFFWIWYLHWVVNDKVIRLLHRGPPAPSISFVVTTFMSLDRLITTTHLNERVV
jgi:hypothetical protein